MSLFGRRKPELQQTLSIDVCQGDEHARYLYDAAGRGEWEVVRDALVALESADDRIFYLDVVTELDGPQQWVRQWVEAEPKSALARITQGAHFINWGWQARSNYQAKYVSEDQFRVFFDRLRIAENSLDEAADLAPDDPNPWSYLIVTAMGRQLGQAEAMRRFREATARCRWHYRSHTRLLQQLCRKWGGSHEAMHEFANQTVAEMPAGSPLGSLVAWAHFEHWHDLDEPHSTEYVEDPAVVASLRAAAEGSIQHPEFRRAPGWPGVHNIFALMFSLVGEWQRAAELFDLIGDRVTGLPWSYYPDGAISTFLRTRTYCYEMAGR